MGRLTRRIREERMARQHAIVEHRSEIEAVRLVDWIARCEAFHQALHWNGAQVVWRSGARPDCFKKACRACGAIERTTCGDLLTAHRRGGMKQAFSGWRGHHRCDFCAAARLTKHHDAIGIATKRLRVLLHPVEGKHEVPLTGIAAIRECTWIKAVEVEIAERVETVIHCDNNHVAFCGEAGSVI